MRLPSPMMVSILIACGGSNQQRKPAAQADAPDDRPAQRTIEQWTTEDENRHVALSCQNLVGADGAFRCELFARVGMDPARCTEQIGSLRGDSADPYHRRAFRNMLARLSVAKSCDEVLTTFQNLIAEARPPAKTRTEGSGDAMVVCQQRKDGSFDLNAEDVLRRRGLGDRTFADTASSLDKPIELCGISGEVDWLTRVTCTDGSRPFGKDLDKAHAARKASRPGKPRCGGPGPYLDIYEVPCPEKKYIVFMDMYECGPGEDVRRSIH